VPADLTGLPAKLARWTERPAPRAAWWADAAVATARQLPGRFDVILANLLPFETATAAARLSRELGIPWVADLDDPWALDEMRVAPTAVNYRIDRARMHRGLRTAAALVMSCPEAAVRVRATFPDLADRVIEPVAHGFNRDDYAGPAPVRDDAAFRIVHTGSLHTQLGRDHRATERKRRLLGGTSLDVDILTRSILYLLEALDRLAAGRPDLAGRIELHLVGHLTPADRALADRDPRIHAYGHLPHPETVAVARSADLLFLPMHDLPPGVRAGIVPCKTYEYLAAERPVLAAVPDGDCRDLLAQFDRAQLVRPADVAGMAAAIAARMDAGPPPAVPDQGLDGPRLAPYERRAMTERIAAVLDGVVGATRPAVAA
jgi:glycosyltransferase involved in cell wall biosynthesis